MGRHKLPIIIIIIIIIAHTEINVSSENQELSTLLTCKPGGVKNIALYVLPTGRNCSLLISAFPSLHFTSFLRIIFQCVTRVTTVSVTYSLWFDDMYFVLFWHSLVNMALIISKQSIALYIVSFSRSKSLWILDKVVPVLFLFCFGVGFWLFVSCFLLLLLLFLYFCCCCFFCFFFGGVAFLVLFPDPG